MTYQAADKRRVAAHLGVTLAAVDLPFAQWMEIRRGHRECCHMFGYAPSALTDNRLD